MESLSIYKIFLLFGRGFWGLSINLVILSIIVLKLSINSTSLSINSASLSINSASLSINSASLSINSAILSIIVPRLSINQNKKRECLPKYTFSPIFYPALTGSKTPTSRLEENNKHWWGSTVRKSPIRSTNNQCGIRNPH